MTARSSASSAKAHAARLDHHVGYGGAGDSRAQPVIGRGIDHDAAPGRRRDVAMALPVEDVGLVEGDVVAERGERPQQAAIVGGGAVPVGRQQARTVEGDVHFAASCCWSIPSWRAAAGRDDCQQFVHPMRAGMALADGLAGRSPRARRARSGSRSTAASCPSSPRRRARSGSPRDRTAPPRRARARRPAECRRPAPRTRGSWGCRAAPST